MANTDSRMVDNGLKTIDQFCAKHNLSRSAFYRIRARQEIEVVKVGHSTRIKPEQEQAWLDSLTAAA